MLKIWNIPIESLEERYSANWNRWFPREFEKAGVEYETIYGDELTRTIEQGAFLDVVGTNYFKASQIQKICQKIYAGEVKDEDIFLFHDFWFPGVESLAYIRDALNLKFKIVGLLHAGTWDPFDFLSRKGMDDWALALENSWLSIADCILVATEFHKSLIKRSREVGCPIHVTGFPIYDEGMHDAEKENVILFPHRLDPEKQPDQFDKLEAAFREKFPGLSDWKFIKTKEYLSQWAPDGLNEQALYLSLLNRAKIAVSFALQETWGIAMQEALFAGCVPFVPGRLSYKEMYPPSLHFNSMEQLLHKIECQILEHGYTSDAIVASRKLLNQGTNAIPNMIRIIKDL